VKHKSNRSILNQENTETGRISEELVKYGMFSESSEDLSILISTIEDFF
jgi:hypothetical protein